MALQPVSDGLTVGGYMKDSHNKRLKGRFIFLWRWISYHTVGFAIWLIVFAVAPNLQAGQIIFSPGNPALASEVNANFGELYTLNPTAWTKTVSDLGYTGGRLGVGIASPAVKFQTDGGSVITLAGATGFGVFGATTGNHIAIDSTQIQTKASATTVAHMALNPLGGFVGVGTAPGVKFNVDNGTAVVTQRLARPRGST